MGWARVGRALLAFLALPGVVAFVVPLVWGGDGRDGRGLVPLGLGVAGLLWCVRDFYVDGRGTLAPWAPPERLVVAGLYRYSRNPMYVAVAMILAGWAIWFRSAGLGIYAVAVCVAFQARVVWGEEPWLARRYGREWEEYCRKVGRWAGRGKGE